MDELEQARCRIMDLEAVVAVAREYRNKVGCQPDELPGTLEEYVAEGERLMTMLDLALKALDDSGSCPVIPPDDLVIQRAVLRGQLAQAGVQISDLVLDQARLKSELVEQGELRSELEKDRNRLRRLAYYLWYAGDHQAAHDRFDDEYGALLDEVIEIVEQEEIDEHLKQFEP